ncbi:MAG TPA: hypothetical protein VJ866_17365 [Pyrinomonadaceae bacterium]|nr:hypothetical protein [Pyrinomonadaceae bacterium]
MSAASLCLGQAREPGGVPARKGPDSTPLFVSLQGRFSVSLPEKVSGYSAISADMPEGRIEGDTFKWRTADGSFEVTYVDLPNVLATKAVFDRSRDNKLVLNRGAKLTGEKDLTLEGNAGRETRFETADGTLIVRTYLVGKRLYEASAFLPNSMKSKEAAAVRVLDSLKLLSQAEVAAARRKEAETLAPAPLPHGKAAAKLKSDAEDEGLKGRVKTVFRESQDLSGTRAVGARKPSSTDYYDGKGQLTKHELYDYKGNLFQVAVYGELDGERVRSDKMIRHEYDPPPLMVGGSPGGPERETDPRYTYKFAYRYDGKGRLVEEDLYDNSGKLWLRYVYKYEGNKKEELVYSEDGSLNQKYVSTLDDKGNEVEESFYDVKDDSVSERYSYSYEFDAKGNWVKRTASKWAAKDGKEQFVPYSITYRTITYY